MRFWWRISRYDPGRRDSRGACQDETWTSISDVGKRFDDGELTLEAYFRVEDAYIDAFTAFAEESDVERVAVKALDQGAGLREGELLRVQDARDVVRRMLREDVICQLEEPDNRLSLHVGFDLYMYVGSERPCVRAVQRTQAAGLYVDNNHPSPQIDDQRLG